MQLFSFKQGFLKKQRVSKRLPKKNNSRNLKTSFFQFLSILALFALLFSFQKLFKKNRFFITQDQLDETWDITTSKQIEGQNKLKHGGLEQSLLQKATVSELAARLEKANPYTDITILQIAPKKLHVKIQERDAVLAIEANGLRKVSSKGEVYSSVSETKLPTLSGIFSEDNLTFELSTRNTLVLNNSEQNKILQAVAITKLAETLRLELDSVHYTPYRGFKITLKGKIEIILGTDDFLHKLEKYVSMKDLMAQKNKSITYMELDYRGKAFIKTKTTGAYVKL